MSPDHRMFECLLVVVEVLILVEILNDYILQVNKI